MNHEQGGSEQIHSQSHFYRTCWGVIGGLVNTVQYVGDVMMIEEGKRQKRRQRSFFWRTYLNDAQTI